MQLIHNTQTRPRSPWILATLLAGAIGSDIDAWTISGTVKSTTGTPIAGVAVTVQDSSKYSTTTDASGAFSFQTVGIGDHGAAPKAFASSLVGDELVVRSPVDGPLGLSLVDASGRSIWSAEAVSAQGIARAHIASDLRSGAIFLRIRHAGGIEYQAVSRGSNGLEFGSDRIAARQMAAYPVLVFKKTGFNDTTYAMAATTASGVVVTMSAATTCPFPTTFKWKDYGSAIAGPATGWVAIKDFTNVLYNGQHIVYGSTHDKSYYGSMGMSAFTKWSDAATATQTKMNTSTVAPELMYFTPKKQWILTYQWGSAKFNYMTSSDPTKPNGWSGGGALLKEDITAATYGPIDQVPICDAKNCYLFYAADNGHIYRASMPIGNFPGLFSGSQDILKDSQSNLFEAVEVYTVKGTGKYLMIVECMGSARYFRAFSATDLGGTWTAISNATGENTPFAGRRNISNPPSWTNDVSHGDLVRSADETRTVDPCNLQLLYQGYAPSFTGLYDLKPYNLGLLTFEGK